MRWIPLAAAALTGLLALLPAPPAAAQSRAYRRIVRDAVTEFDRGNWAEARALFEQAHELAPSARTLRGLGMCAFELREYPEALELLASSLDDLRRPLEPHQRAEVEELLARARTFVGRYLVATDPPTAELRVDDGPPTLSHRGEVVLGLGIHVLTASLPGYETARERVEVRGGESAQLTLTLVDPNAVVAEAEPTRPGLPIGPLAVLAAGAGTLAFGGFTIGWTVDRVTELDACQAPPEGMRCINEGTLGEQRDAAVVSMITAAVATVGLGVAGAIWWWLETQGRPAESASSPGCAPAGSGLRCRF